MSDKAEVLVTGASGLVGAGLARRRDIIALPRTEVRSGAPYWDQKASTMINAPEKIQGLVHLAGAPVAAGRWTKKVKKEIYDSRINGTRGLVHYLSERPQKPDVFICASAIGLYGNRGDEVLTEESSRGKGFLADVVADWETEADAALKLGIRVVKLRIGIVLAENGGALGKMLPAFRLGLGGPLGNGQQWFPWVHLEDLLNVIEWALTDNDAQGAYNVVSPNICRQKEFAKELGSVLKKPAIMPAPRAALKLAMGDMADEALLSSARVAPQRLQQKDFQWAFPELRPALENILES